MNRNSAPLSNSNPTSRFVRWFTPALPDTGAAFFFRAALLSALYLGVDWAQHRSSSYPRSTSVVVVISAGLIGLFLLLALGFYAWERRLRRQLQLKQARGFPNDRSA